MASSASDGLKTSAAIKVILLSYGSILKSFSKRFLAISKLLLTISEVSLKKTLNSIYKRPKIRHFIFSISYLS